MSAPVAVITQGSVGIIELARPEKFNEKYLNLKA